MKILVINCGSSSLKYQLIEMDTEKVLAKGLVERIGLGGAILTQTAGERKTVRETPLPDHQAAIDLVLSILCDKTEGVIKDMSEIKAVGHRVVHGGERYADAVVVNDDVMICLEDCAKLAPLHNPPNITGIRACQALMLNTPMVAVFDTAFHQTMPQEAYIYPIDYELYRKYKIRKYGFHGTSHKYVAYKLAEVLGKNIQDLKIISCHLGNGDSLTAIKGGKSVDTSMGFTPLAGIMMGTRSGNIDPSIVTYMINECGYSSTEVDQILNKKSGVLGVSGVSSDFRDVGAAAKAGNPRAQLALDIFHYRVRRQIGAYAASMGGVDAIIFTGGIGENAIDTRKECVKGLEFMGVHVDNSRNQVRGQIQEISPEGSNVKVYVIPTNEELMIAKETLQLVKA